MRNDRIDRILALIDSALEYEAHLQASAAPLATVLAFPRSTEGRVGGGTDFGNAAA
jgi:hypothetical protein